MIKHKPIDHYLHLWDRRYRLTQSLIWGPRGLAAGLLVAVSLAIAARIWPLFTLPWLAGLAILWSAMGLLGALLLVWLWPRPELEQARFFDQALQLKERTSTALEIQQENIIAPQEWAAKQLADAQQAAETADPGAAFPLRLNRPDWVPVLAALALLAAAVWLPNPMQDILAERAEIREVIEEEIQQVEAIRDEIAADPQLSQEDREALLDILEGAIEELQTGELTPEEALAELSQASEKLRDLTNDQADQQAAGLRNAAQGLKDSPLTAALAEALENGNLELAAELLEDLSNDLGEELSREEELELAEQLAEAAAELAETNPELAQQLAEAAQNIQSGDMAAAQQALGQASQTTSRTAQQAAASQAAQQAANQMARSGQQVAQAGNQAGQGSQGSMQNQGQDGQGGGAGRGEGDGEGTGRPESDMNGSNGPGDGGLRAYESLYAPQRLGGESGEELELSQSGDPGELLRELPSNPEIGQSTVPYNQIYADYAAAAGRALENQHIPLGMRNYVRDYFGSLEPEP